MLKNLTKIAIIIFVLISIGCNYCYADSIDVPPYEELTMYDGGMFIIGAIVLVVTLISFFILRNVAKRRGVSDSKEKRNVPKKISKILLVISIITAVAMAIGIIVSMMDF